MTHTPLLQTPRLPLPLTLPLTLPLPLRLPDARDAEAYIAFRMSDRAAMSGGVKDRLDAWRAFAMIIGHWTLRGFGLFSAVQKSDAAPIGPIGNWAPEGWPQREIGWFVLPSARGNGVATQAARAALRHCLGPMGMDSLVSYIAAADNTASLNVAQRPGGVRLADGTHPEADVVTHHYTRAGGPQ